MEINGMEKHTPEYSRRSFKLGRVRAVLNLHMLDNCGSINVVVLVLAYSIRSNKKDWMRFETVGGHISFGLITAG